MIRRRINALSARDRRALGVMAVGALAFVVLQFTVLPLLDSAGGLRAQIPAKEKTLRKYEHAVALSGPRENDWLSLRDRAAALDRRLLDSNTPALAAAEVQALLKQVMASAGVEMRGADFLPPRPVRAGAATYTAVPVAVSIEGPVDQVAGFLTLARAAPKLLAVDQLSLMHVASADRPRKAVSVRLALHGLMRPQTASEPGEAGTRRGP